MKLKDPRRYTEEYPKHNILINQALDFLADRPQNIDETITNLLIKQNDTLINLAINLSPNYQVTKTIWDALNRVLELNIFAIPIVLVLGSKTRNILNPELNLEKLNNFFVDKQILTNAFVSGKLIDLPTLAKFKFSQIYYWSQNIANVKLWLPVEINPPKVEVINEGVYLRFLVGVTKAAINQDNFKANSLELMKFINSELNTPGVTLFSMPFSPSNLITALSLGDNYRKEIAISVAISNITKKIREQRHTPIAKIETNIDAIEVTVTNKEKNNIVEKSVWSLNKYDDFKAILHTIENLLIDMQIAYE